MIVIVAEDPRERAAFGSVCDSRGWPWAECESIHAFKRLLRSTRPKIVLTRYRLRDGYSDEVITALKAAGLLPATKLVVLVIAGSSPSLEARQLVLGADLVQRDPVRMEVLVEYLSKFLAAAKHTRSSKSQPILAPFRFAGTRVHPVDRKLQRGKRSRRLTPREIELADVLAQSAGQVVTYETLFNDILGRRFRGDTSNLRVLLGKLAISARQVGIELRDWVEVIPKLGYRYHPTRSKLRHRLQK